MSSEFEEKTKKCQKLERELKCITDKEKQYSEKNINLQDNLDEYQEKYISLSNEHTALVNKYEQFEKVHEEMKNNYDINHLTLKKVNKERQKLYEDSIRSERIIKSNEKTIEELETALERETINYDKIKIRFSEIEIEYESSEITKKKEIRKYEIEKDIIQEK